MLKTFITLILLFLSLSALACNETGKPKITIGKEPENSSGCTLYQILYPKKYKGANLSSITLNTSEPEVKYYMDIMPHGNDKLWSSIICANDDWFKTGTLSLVYKTPKSKDGGIRGCFDWYEYDNLTKYIKR